MTDEFVRRERQTTRTDDVAVARRALERTHSVVSLDVDAAGRPFLFDETIVSSRLLSLESTKSSGTVSGTARTGDQMVVMWLKSGRGSIGRRRAPIGRPILFREGDEPFRWSSFQQDALRIDRDVVQRIAAERGGWTPQPLEFKPHHVPEGATLAAWWLMVRQVATEIFDSPAEVSTQRDLELTCIAAAGLLTAIPHWPAGARGSAPARTRLARAEAFLLEHVAEDLLVTDIATAAEMSVRGLQAAFQRAHGTSPLSYLRRIRLQMAHDLLSTAVVTSVAEAARSVGISHLGRFASNYQAEFDELPRHTLRAAVEGA